MGVSLIDSKYWNDPAYTADGLYWTSSFTKSLTLTSPSQFLLCLFGGYAESNAFMSPDAPKDAYYRAWNSSGNNLDLMESPAVTIDNAPSCQLIKKQAPDSGAHTLEVGFFQAPRVYGSLMALGLSGIDFMTPLTNPGVRESYSVANSTGTSASKTHTTTNPNDALFYVFCVRGTPTVTASGTVLANLVSTDSNCRTIFGWTSGSFSPACSFSWSGAQYWSLATAVMAAHPAGGQIAIIG